MNALVLADLAAKKVPINESTVRPGYLAMLIVAIMCVATYFLIRSFISQTKKVDFPVDGDTKPTPPGTTSRS